MQHTRPSPGQPPRRAAPPFPDRLPRKAAALVHASTHTHARVPAHTQPLFAGLPAAAPPRPGCSSRVSMCCYLFHSGAIQGSDSSGRVPAPRPHAQPQSHCDRHSLLPAPPALCGGGTHIGLHRAPMLLSGPWGCWRPLGQPIGDSVPALFHSLEVYGAAGVSGARTPGSPLCWGGSNIRSPSFTYSHLTS